MDTHEPTENRLTEDRSREPAIDARVRPIAVRPRGGFVVVSGIEPAMPGAEDLRDPADEWLLPRLGTPDNEVGPLAVGVGLLRDFSGLADHLSADSICAFADQRGWLGVQMPVRRSATSRQGADDDVEPAVRAWTVGGGPLGEPIRMWRKEILRVRALKDLWGAVMAIREPWKAAGLAADAIDRAKALLGASIQWSQGQMAYSIQMAYPIRPEQVGPDFVWPRDWNPIRGSGVLSKIPTGDLATAGTYVVCHEINQSLEGRVDTTLLPFRSCEMRQVPQTLLASIYLQLAIEVAGGTGWRVCQFPGCGTRYPGPRNSKYCDRGTRTHRNAAAYLKQVGNLGKEASR